MPGAFGKAYARLNAQQKQAVDTIEGPVLVIAGPGTGKTQLLSTRIANILDKTDTLPSNILCLTFTDSAATTMRERLTAIIGQAAYDVAISTYHAFGSELIRRYPEYFMVDADLQPADDLTIDAILRDIFARLPYSNPLRHDIFLRDIKTFISDAKRALLDPEDIRRVADENEAFIAAATTVIEKFIPSFARLDKTAALSFVKLLDATTLLPDDSSAVNVVGLRSLWQPQLETAVGFFQATGKTTELTKWKNAWLAKDDNGNFIANGTEQVRRLRAAATIYERYLQELARNGYYDYDDMILRAIRGLATNPDLRYTLQERYLYLLLDEFQDTNEAQLRLVELLTDSPVHEGRPNVLAVGDDDQAIYAFQGANYSHMLEFSKLYRDVLVVPLTENYRSTPAILQVASGIAGQIAERLHQYFPGINKDIGATKQIATPDQALARYDFKSDLSQNTWVTGKISELLAAGVAGNEIAVLAPKHEYLEGLVPFLHHANIPIHYDKRENVLDDRSVRELVIMSQLVLALAQHEQARADSLWPEVLSFGCWGLRTAFIWQLSWEADDTHAALSDVLCKHTETKPLALFLIRLSQIAAREPLERMLDFMIGIADTDLGGSETYRSPFYKHHFGELKEDSDDTANLWQLLSNLTVLRQRIREYRSTELEPLYLPDFVEFVSAHQAANIKLLNTNPYQEAPDAVELMTVYRAKGQEFKAVFLLAGIDEVWGSKARNLGSRLSLPENLQFMRYAGTTEDERLRLLYVAITRARSQLYITSYTTTYSGRPTTRLKYLDEHPDETGQITSPLLPAGSQHVQMTDTTVPALADLTVYWQHRHYHAINQPKLKDLLRPRLAHFQLSPTELNCFSDVTSDGPSTFFTQSLLKFPAAPTPAGQYGSSIHKTLEWIHLYNKNHGKVPTRVAVLQFFEHDLRSRRIGAPQTSLLLDRGREALPVYLKQRTATIQSRNLAEYSFRNEGVFVGKAHLTGKIDKLMINSEAKTLTIVDYKTGRAYKRWARETKLHAYRQQLYFYKLLVERSHTFAGYRVEDAYLEFVEPDESGHIQELHVTFDDALMHDMEQLIQAIWQHIMELHFPDTTDYSSDSKGIEAFQSDLAAGRI